MKRNTAVVVIIVVAVIAFILGRMTVFVPQPEGEKAELQKGVKPGFAGAEKHEITKAEALKLIQNYQKGMPLKAAKRKAPSLKGGSFDRAAIDRILSQPGCQKLRFYFALDDSSRQTILLVGVDTSGKDMMMGTILDRSWPCPPYCD